ncbi:hypothetical protein D4764_20G0000280 [Takifugu flavidus]|uniref:Uncharacterized protein n=1 Tax=Takifugu flavidus TaxID=433684 RepID=A0A5C6NG07_9TELE|nr:hypothetical protein D4764_20G0000280 [Takifugu flavidus]
MSQHRPVFHEVLIKARLQPHLQTAAPRWFWPKSDAGINISGVPDLQPELPWTWGDACGARRSSPKADRRYCTVTAPRRPGELNSVVPWTCLLFLPKTGMSFRSVGSEARRNAGLRDTNPERSAAPSPRQRRPLHDSTRSYLAGARHANEAYGCLSAVGGGSGASSSPLRQSHPELLSSFHSGGLRVCSRESLMNPDPDWIKIAAPDLCGPHPRREGRTRGKAGLTGSLCVWPAGRTDASAGRQQFCHQLEQTLEAPRAGLTGQEGTRYEGRKSDKI